MPLHGAPVRGGAIVGYSRCSREETPAPCEVSAEANQSRSSVMASWSTFGSSTINPHMWNGPRCKVLFSRFHHMGTVRSYVRPTCAVMTAGLDEVRETGGWIKGARFVRVTGFGLSCFGISSRGSSSVMHPTCRRLPGSSSRRSCAYTAADPTSIPIGSR